MRIGKLMFIPLILLILAGCAGDQQSIVNRHADALLTKTNELQFRFKLNEKILSQNEQYMVRVTIHNEELANALGATEIIYGKENGQAAEIIEPVRNKEIFIYMEPIPLQQDLHVFDIEKMIVNDEAVSVELLNDNEVIAKGFLTHFSSQI
ncbi:hypothetical protein ACUXCC_004504 [Cytobacillus horneckiae]|uniref:Lipoprotein n=1 Tax=Cytobacillus horneckiae TaxID=549687 RepID=A0A2N0Z8X8_9BACI|nr:hypothetical protein [Cytobacillus horneckiae]MBN6889236.1 hypothetical protein [Cytobacillus horneckiae]MCM3178456.1 hypothetical protein [Cytobacillus horneckiae]MEC1156806.1 hypothetical protein [Cytobacillus horneckiae]MED2940566.1 hypothetical protein [Cytobacillus horneckiae]PKG25962.1 hypothetical protein CWS20_26680 [Cytobacillus horneckiae]